MASAPLTSIDILWLLLCSALVMLMQAGFCSLEAGLVRTKNSVNVAMKNLLDFMVAGLVFLLLGYGLIYGPSMFGFVGHPWRWFEAELDLLGQVTLLFQLMFCGAAVTIVSGAVAERMRLAVYLVVSVWVAAVVYPLFAHWAWNSSDGWLAKLGFIDFAGSSVVHAVGGWASLALVLLIGSRRGRFDFDRHTIQGANIPLATLGVLLLWIGWIGFNGGSFGHFSERVPGVVLNTVLGGMVGGIAGLLFSFSARALVDIRFVMIGTIAGLVSITASAHIIRIPEALFIGGAGAVLACLTMIWLDRLQVDDAIDAFAAHGVAGMWGTLAVALFGNPAAFLEGHTRLDQLTVQAIGVLVCGLWTFVSVYGPFRLLKVWVPLRVGRLEEIQGLNMTEHQVGNELRDLLLDMEAHKQSDLFDQPAHVEPYTEVGQVADRYNSVMEQMVNEKAKALEMAQAAFKAEREGRLLREQLEQKVNELNEIMRVTVGREMRMIALKEEINVLAGKAGEPPPYDLGFWEKDEYLHNA